VPLVVRAPWPTGVVGSGVEAEAAEELGTVWAMGSVGLGLALPFMLPLAAVICSGCGSNGAATGALYGAERGGAV
jgi:hypothetical protein